MTVVTGQSGPDDTPDLVANLVAEVNDLRGRLSESEGTNHDLAQLVMNLRVERDRLTNQYDRIVTLTEQRDRARDVAVALEQEIAILEDWRAKHPDQPTGPGELDQIFRDGKRTIRTTVKGTVTLDDPPLSDAFLTATRGTVGDPGRYISFLGAHEYGDPAVREATEELAREIVQNEWARRDLALGGLFTGWAPRPLVGRPHGWTFTVWGTPAVDFEHDRREYENTPAPARDSSEQSETDCDCWHDGRWHVAGSAGCQRSQGDVAADDPGALADPDEDGTHG